MNSTKRLVVLVGLTFFAVITALAGTADSVASDRSSRSADDVWIMLDPESGGMLVGERPIRLDDPVESAEEMLAPVLGSQLDEASGAAGLRYELPEGGTLELSADPAVGTVTRIEFDGPGIFTRDGVTHDMPRSEVHERFGSPDTEGGSADYGFSDIYFLDPISLVRGITEQRFVVALRAAYDPKERLERLELYLENPETTGMERGERPEIVKLEETENGVRLRSELGHFSCVLPPGFELASETLIRPSTVFVMANQGHSRTVTIRSSAVANALSDLGKETLLERHIEFTQQYDHLVPARSETRRVNDTTWRVFVAKKEIQGGKRYKSAHALVGDRVMTINVIDKQRGWLDTEDGRSFMKSIEFF